MSMSEKIEKKKQAILKVLQDADKSLTSAKITRQLQEMGYELSGRTIRLYLQELDRQGLTRNQGKRGRSITDSGRGELAAQKTFEKVGIMAARIDQLAYNMTFNLANPSGTVIINISMLPIARLHTVIPLMQKVFKAGYTMGQMLAVFPPAARVGGSEVPPDCVGIGTVCSV
ncbi:DUF128 domain-containing protein, partial [candidate division FCPU426 bacterium]|nr:DUF128 domain-containing protein [candidate division FCPU426 bacterium]